MEISKNDTKILKGMAILFMVLLHLFATKDARGLFYTTPLINGVSWSYYIALLGDACRPIYMFVTGYAFFVTFSKSTESIFGKNLKRILKLYVNYWTVFLIFIPMGFLIGKDQFFKFDISNLVLDFLGLKNTYNGAWWFVQVYIIFVIVSPILVKIVQKYNYLLIIALTGVIYFLSHVQRYKGIIDFGDHPVALYLVNLTVLSGSTLISFMIGAIFAKEKFYTKIHNKFHMIRFKNTICCVGIMSLIVFHGIIESSIIAPINAVIFICLFLLMNKGSRVTKVLNFVSNHSTNIWLTHMFFYLTIFPSLTFAPKHPILIFIWLIALCIGTSYVIKLITNPIYKMIDRKSVRLSRQHNAQIPA